jgi:hypothetical protein
MHVYRCVIIIEGFMRRNENNTVCESRCQVEGCYFSKVVFFSDGCQGCACYECELRTNPSTPTSRDFEKEEKLINRKLH